jgi:hypothetical protein
MTRIYLDNCCFNRPYDNQENIKVQIETESKLYILSSVVISFLLFVGKEILCASVAIPPLKEINCINDCN